MHTNDWSSRNEISLVHIKHPPVLHCRVRQCNTQTYAVCVCVLVLTIRILIISGLTHQLTSSQSTCLEWTENPWFTKMIN